jgi:hypothetical protein
VSFASDQYGQFDLSEPEGPPPSIVWRSWPLRDSFAGAASTLALLIAAGSGVRWITGQTHLAVLAVAVLVLALWRFFLPTAFELSSEGVSQWLLGRRRRIPWRAIRRYEICSSGVLLLPRADACPIDACRGLYLPWGPHRHEVLAHVRYYLDRPSGV